MYNLKIEQVEMVKSHKDSIVNITLCNTLDEIYYLQKRFQGWDDVIWGYDVIQDGKELHYKGLRVKMKTAKFPDDYIAIAPKECITIGTKLNQFFDFDPNKEIVLSYYIRNKNPKTGESGQIEFKTTLIATEKKEH